MTGHAEPSGRVRETVVVGAHGSVMAGRAGWVVSLTRGTVRAAHAGPRSLGRAEPS